MTPDERQLNEQRRERARNRLSRTHMRTPDHMDLLHLADLLAEVWDEGHRGIYPEDNPYRV